MKVIIVDDETIAAEAMKRRIKWDKYGVEQVFLAGSMKQAIEIMEREPVNLMLCDVEMPGGSGLELYEWVRTYSPDTECIFVSCHPEYEYVRKALTMGSMDYVLKPVDYEEMDVILTNAVERILQRGSENNQPSVKVGITSEKKKIYSTDAVNEAVGYINLHLSENLSINEIAGVAHLNPQYFMRLFKKETGKPVLEYITDERLSLARHLLQETNMSITEVSLSSGYDNFAYFSKLFKKNEGLSPSDFRKLKS